MSSAQSELFDASFETTRPANPVYCHQEFLEKLETYRHHPVGKRAALLLQRLAVDERRQHYKGASGPNRGWRRSRLGGNRGSHFYAWWAPKTAPPFKDSGGFLDAPEGALFLRDIRHHDDHSPATVQTFHGHYLPVSVREMRREEYGPAPWTPQQTRFASARHNVRVLKGHPGSGKTTALLHAADASGAARVLYLTYSRDLAALASQYFDRYCSRDRRFQVLTFEVFLRRLLRADPPRADPRELRQRFRGDLVPFSRSLGAWTDRSTALYDELHAHLVGAALPIAAGRFAACTQPRSDEKNYRARRTRYLGDGAATTALHLAARLERSNSQSLAALYFPELDLAWRAAAALLGKSAEHVPSEFLDVDCIAVDECQDLTPLEALVVVELASAAGRSHGAPVSLYLAGDEAQTVRPTDFEWGWMHDLLHHRLATPAEFKLASNLRSPRTIAQLVNRVWDLYAEVQKRDRPSGSGYAEVEDDSTDQILYCAASPGPDLDHLVTDLAAREGLAIVTFDEAATAVLPEAVRPFVLTASDVKGLDFHTICVVNAGRQLDAIVGWRRDYELAGDLESIRRRLAIDELRVALSRPAERLIWLDISPAPKTVHNTLDFLNRDHPDRVVSPCIPSALLTALEEEQLGIEERIERCQSDARQYLAVKPEAAWSRAQQAVALLGEHSNPAAVHDDALRRAARLTLAEVCFCLAFRNVSLAPELGRPDLFGEAATAAAAAGRFGLAAVLRDVASVLHAPSNEHTGRLGRLAQSFTAQAADLEPWLLLEIGAKTTAWVEELEAALPAGDNALILPRILRPFYAALRLPDADSRAARLEERAIRLLVKNRRHKEALALLAQLGHPKPALEAECLEAVGEYGRAAEIFRSLGDLKRALDCYRALPDFDAAITLLRELGAHPAAESYEWLERLRRLLAERPPNFNRAMQASEKQILQTLLEQALGVTRRTPVPRRKAPAKRPARTRP
jgi:hypothetical protein